MRKWMVYSMAGLGMLLVVMFNLWWSYEPPLTKVRIAVSKTPLSTPVYLARQLGYFKAAGVDVDLIEVAGGHRSFQKVREGDAEFGTSSDSVIMFGAFQTDSVVNVATFVQSDNDIKILVLADSKIYRSADLLNRRVGVVSKSASEYFLDVFLSIDGLKSAQIVKVVLQPEHMQDALTTGEVDAIVVWEPYAYKAVKLLGDSVRILPGKSMFSITFNLVAQRAWVAKHPETSRAVLLALQNSINFVHQYPQESQQLMRSRLGLEQSFFDWVWDDYLFKLSLNRSLVYGLQSQAHWAMENGLVTAERAPDYRQIIDAEPLQGVASQAVAF